MLGKPKIVDQRHAQRVKTMPLLFDTNKMVLLAYRASGRPILLLR